MKSFTLKLYTTLLVILLASITATSFAQCVVINEVLVNGPGGCDGGCNPNTEEWTEFYNSCDSSVNIGCYVLTDGRFTVTIPQGTILPAHSFYVIGSSNSPATVTPIGTVNLNISTCGCTGGTLIGTFTNTNWQVILADPSGNVVNGVYWGNGKFPINITSPSSGSCGGVNVSLSSPGANMEKVPNTSSNQGCTAARQCDGSTTWDVRCSPSITMGTSNGAPPFPAFSASDSIICTSTCISFNDKTTGGIPSGWSWSFSGASTSSSSSQNPVNICYNTPGSFDVTLNASNSCGSFSKTKTGYIKVTNLPSPVITPSVPITLCTGDSATIQTTSTGSLQWNLDGNPISGATEQAYNVKSSGNYTLSVSNGNCSGTSLPVTVQVSNLPVAQISPQGPISVCPGTTVTLNSDTLYYNYQWNFNGNPITGATNQQYVTDVEGSYSLTYSNGSCSSISDSVTVKIKSTISDSVKIIADAQTICKGTPVNFTAIPINGGNSPVYEWEINGVKSGANSSSFSSDTLNNGDIISCRMKSDLACVTDSVVFSNSVIIAVNQSTVAGSLTAPKTTVCANTIVHLSVTGGSGANIKWESSPDSLSGYSNINGVTSLSYSSPPMVNTTYYRIISGNGPCSDTSSVFKITVIKAPLASYIFSVKGHQVTFNSDASTGATSYFWDFGDGTTSTDESPVHNFDTAGVFHVCLTVKNNSNCNFTLCQNVQAFQTGINELSKVSNWLVYPNPVCDYLLISSSESNSDIESIEVFDIPGRKVISKKYIRNTDNPFKIDVSFLVEGIYFIKIKTSSSDIVLPVIKR